MRASRRQLLVTMVAAALIAAGFASARAIASRSDAPPGATALCKHGTYSFSAARSGTCSHHGEVAEWLVARTTTQLTTSTTAITTTIPGAPGRSNGTGPATTTSSEQLSPYCTFNVELNYVPGLAIYFPFSYADLGSLTQQTLDFGDGTSAEVQAGQLEINHTYKAKGTYVASISCADSAGRTASQSETVSVGDLPATTSVRTTTVVSSTIATTTATVPAAAGPAGSATGSGRSAVPGSTVLLAPRSKTSGCLLGAEPDRHCSPGAYSSGLTRAVICSSSFHTGSIRNVSESEKHQVEAEYGMAAKSYGSTLEIDHIVSLEFGGSNDVANLFPERATPEPGYHVKDKLENTLHDLVCSGAMTLHAAQEAIATDWEALYKRVFGVAP